jgi:hypothetical protein
MNWGGLVRASGFRSGFRRPAMWALTMDQWKWPCLLTANRKQFGKLYWRSGFQGILCSNPRILDYYISGAWAFRILIGVRGLALRNPGMRQWASCIHTHSSLPDSKIGILRGAKSVQLRTSFIKRNEIFEKLLDLISRSEKFKNQ